MCYTFDLPLRAPGAPAGEPGPRKSTVRGQGLTRPFPSQESKRDMSHTSRRCSALRADGRPCRAWAVRDSEPARCPSHIGPEQSEPQEGESQASGRTIDEAADLPSENVDEALANQLREMQLLVRQILAQLQHELDPDEYARLVNLAFKGAHTVTDISRALKALSGKAKGGLPPEFEEAIEKVKRMHRTEP